MERRLAEVQLSKETSQSIDSVASSDIDVSPQVTVVHCPGMAIGALW